MCSQVLRFSLVTDWDWVLRMSLVILEVLRFHVLRFSLAIRHIIYFFAGSCLTILLANRIHGHGGDWYNHIG